MELKLAIDNPSVSEEEKPGVLSKDDNTCQFCGFKAEKFQEAMMFEDEPVVACSFCFQTLNLDVCAERRAGYLIYLPELTQVELNHILRAIYVARTDLNPEIADKARHCFDILAARRKIARNILGTDSPETLGEIISSFMSDEEKEQISQKLSGIKLMSLDKKIEIEDGMEFNEFPQMLNFWKSNVDFLNQPCSNWEKIEIIDSKEENPVIEDKESVDNEEVLVQEDVKEEDVNG